MERKSQDDAVLIGKNNVTIDYTNYRGERAIRRIVPMRIDFGKNQWHKEDHWILTAFDLDKDQIRAFSIKDIHKWTEG